MFFTSVQSETVKSVNNTDKKTATKSVSILGRPTAEHL